MKTISLTINNNKFSCLVAETNKEKEIGLMYVQPPPPIMIFPYKYAQENNFWMKNTPSPLDIIFCLNNKITKIKNGEPYSLELIKGGISDLIIEMPSGFVSKYNIKIGDSITLGE